VFLRNWARLYSAPTKHEELMEVAVAGLGSPYRTQHPFFSLHHIADFYLPGIQVVVEVDGASHRKPAQILKDKLHTLQLARLGIKVVRCQNEEVEADPKGTLAKLLLQAEQTPLPEGELDLQIAQLKEQLRPKKPKKRKPRA
jgi:very-short-patch-repair endonuclease